MTQSGLGIGNDPTASDIILRTKIWIYFDYRVYLKGRYH